MPIAMQIAQIKCITAKNTPKDNPVFVLSNILPPFYRFLRNLILKMFLKTFFIFNFEFLWKIGKK
jgi:hypothetical protein